MLDLKRVITKKSRMFWD